MARAVLLLLAILVAVAFAVPQRRTCLKRMEVPVCHRASRYYSSLLLLTPWFSARPLIGTDPSQPKPLIKSPLPRDTPPDAWDWRSASANGVSLLTPIRNQHSTPFQFAQ